MSVLQEASENVAKRDGVDLESFVWKTEKVKTIDGRIIQNEVKLIDCNEEQLKKFYAHCNTMLWNEDKANPGRNILLEIIKDQIIRCNTELFLRDLEKNKLMGRFKFVTSIRSVLDNNPGINPKDLVLSDVTGGCLDEFKDLPLSIVIDGALDRLGKFNSQHITLPFILKHGLWFTQQEIKDLNEIGEDGNLKNRVDVVKERLGLKSHINIHLTPKGLSYAQMRACITLKSKKYTELTTDQLLILRNRILFSLEDLVNLHIKSWESRKDQLIAIAEAKNFNIV